MRSVLTLLTATVLLLAAGCSDSEPASAPTPESVEAAPPPAEEAAAPVAAEAAEVAAAETDAAPEAAAAEPVAADAPAAAAAGGAYVGSVMYEDEAAVGRGKPLAGAAVSQHGVAQGPSTTSDAKGGFSLALVETQNPAILVSAKGYVASLTTFSKDRSAEGNEPIMLFDRADEAAISADDYGVKYNGELGGVVLSFQALTGDDAHLVGLSATIDAKNAGGFLFPSTPEAEGAPTKGTKLGKGNDPMVFFPGVAPGTAKITVTPPGKVNCIGPTSAAVLADTYTTVLFQCS